MRGEGRSVRRVGVGDPGPGEFDVFVLGRKRGVREGEGWAFTAEAKRVRLGS